MKRALIVFAAAAALSLATVPARAGGGDVAAGLVGGLAIGTILGATMAQPRYAPPPPTYYVEPAPVYVAPPPPRCYWTRAEPMWDGYGWRRPRVRVCD